MPVTQGIELDTWKTTQAIHILYSYEMAWQVTLPGLDPLGIIMAKTKTPLADGFVGDVDSPTHQNFFHIPEA